MDVESDLVVYFVDTIYCLELTDPIKSKTSANTHKMMDRASCVVNCPDEKTVPEIGKNYIFKEIGKEIVGMVQEVIRLNNTAYPSSYYVVKFKCMTFNQNISRFIANDQHKYQDILDGAEEEVYNDNPLGLKHPTIEDL